MADEVLVEYSDRVAVMTINRPQARNAVNRAVSVLLAEALDELDRRDDLTVGILTGAGGLIRLPGASRPASPWS